ncbi:MAG: HEPN domain-containing protein [Muribaculaceae bacterium]|nr:HEPN domain-containing protein [Muribaculaceae bacterium]
MTDTLSNRERIELVRYRLDRSRLSFEEAEFLASGRFYNSAINRLYYSCFYAVNALLIKNGIEVGTHAGAKTMLNLHFVMNGPIPKSQAKIYSLLFDSRQSGDYADFVYYDKEEYDNYLPKVKELLATIRGLIEQSPASPENTESIIS